MMTTTTDYPVGLYDEAWREVEAKRIRAGARRPGWLRLRRAGARGTLRSAAGQGLRRAHQR